MHSRGHRGFTGIKTTSPKSLSGMRSGTPEEIGDSPGIHRDQRIIERGTQNTNGIHAKPGGSPSVPQEAPSSERGWGESHAVSYGVSIGGDARRGGVDQVTLKMAKILGNQKGCIDLGSEVAKDREGRNSSSYKDVEKIKLGDLVCLQVVGSKFQRRAQQGFMTDTQISGLPKKESKHINSFSGMEALVLQAIFTECFTYVFGLGPRLGLWCFLDIHLVKYHDFSPPSGSKKGSRRELQRWQPEDPTDDEQDPLGSLSHPNTSSGRWDQFAANEKVILPRLYHVHAEKRGKIMGSRWLWIRGRCLIEIPWSFTGYEYRTCVEKHFVVMLRNSREVCVGVIHAAFRDTERYEW
eukprot:1315942-Amorphochlora_amoeboformis.AAC.1